MKCTQYNTITLPFRSGKIYDRFAIHEAPFQHFIFETVLQEYIDKQEEHPIRLSVRLSSCHQELFMSVYSWKKWCPCQISRSEDFIFRTMLLTLCEGQLQRGEINAKSLPRISTRTNWCGGRSSTTSQDGASRLRFGTLCVDCELHAVKCWLSASELTYEVQVNSCECCIYGK